MASSQGRLEVARRTLPCTLERMVREWDGSSEGLSLYYLIAHCTDWKLEAASHWKTGDLEHVIFKGDGGSFAVEFRTSRWLRNGAADGLQSNPSIRVTFNASHVGDFPATTIESLDAGVHGQSKFVLLTDYGEGNNRFKVLSIDVMGPYDHLEKQRKQALEIGAYNPTALIDMPSGHLWLARVALGLAIDWGTHALPAKFPPFEETSRQFAAFMDLNKYR